MMITKLRWMIPTALIAAIVALMAAIPPGTALAGSCPAPSADGTYHAGLMVQYDTDNPVRPTYNNPDKNLTARGALSLVGASSGLNSGYATSDATPPPQLATIFNPARVPTFVDDYQVNGWNWISSGLPGAPGTPGSAISSPAVTAVSMMTTPGEALRSPCHGYNLGSPWGVGGMAVLYADSTSITLVSTRYDSVAPHGYGIHILGINTNPTLLALYNSLDSGNRYVYHGGGFNLPGLMPGQIFGTAGGSSITVAYRDTGAFMDPLDQHNWWQVTSWPATTTTPGVPPPPQVPVLTAPRNGVTVRRIPNLVWKGIKGAKGYAVEISSASDCSSPVVVGNPTRSSYKPASLNAGVYYWCAQALDSSYNWSAWSAPFSFVFSPIPHAPQLISPLTRFVSTSATPTFTWYPVQWGVNYELEIGGYHFTTVAYDTIQADTGRPSTALAPGIYYWRVRAINALGDVSRWSKILSFTISGP